MGFTDQKWGESNGLKNSSDINLDKYNKMFKISINEFTPEQQANVIKSRVNVLFGHGSMRYLYWPCKYALQRKNGEQYIINGAKICYYYKSYTCITEHGNVIYDFVRFTGFESGFGTITYPVDLGYTGDIMNGRPHGIGTLNDIIDGEIKKGTFENGIFIEGVLINKYERCEGTFNDNGELYGKGVIYYKNGDCYRGDFIDGKGNGEGILYVNGETFKGNFVDGVFQH